MPLRTRALPFDDPNWIFELKYDGFRALAVIDRRPQLVSRNGNSFGSFAELAKQLQNISPATPSLMARSLLSTAGANRDSTISCSIAARRASLRLTCSRLMAGIGGRINCWSESKNSAVFCRVFQQSVVSAVSIILTAKVQHYSRECASWTSKESWPNTSTRPTWKTASNRRG
jgi:hypothetical protein